MTGVFVRKGLRDTGRRPCEDRDRDPVMQPQAEDQPDPPEDRRGRKDPPPPRGPEAQREWALLTP